MAFARSGSNELSPIPSQPEIVRLFKHLFGYFASMLWIGAIMCFALFTIEAQLHEVGRYTKMDRYVIFVFVLQTIPLYNLWLAIILILLVLASGFVGYYLEYKSEISSFTKLSPRETNVIRNGVKVRYLFWI